MQILEVTSYLATLLTILTVYLISIPTRKAFLFGTFCHILWIIYGISTKQLAISIQSVVLLALNTKSWISWYKQGIG